MSVTMSILNLFYLLSILISSVGAHGVSIQAYGYKNSQVISTIDNMCLFFERLSVLVYKMVLF